MSDQSIEVREQAGLCNFTGELAEQNQASRLVHVVGQTAVWGRHNLAKPLLAAAVLAAPPVAGWFTLEHVAPPVSVSNFPVVDVSTTAALNFGHDSSRYAVPNIIGIKLPKSVTIPGLHKKVGISVESSADDLNLITSKGIDSQKVDSIRQTVEGADTKVEFTKLTNKVVEHYEKWGFGAMYLTLLVESGYFIERTAYRRKMAQRNAHEQAIIKEQSETRRKLTKAVSILSAAALLADTTYTTSPVSSHHDVIVADPVLDGVAGLDGAQLTGPGAGLVDQIGPKVSTILEARKNFTQQASKNQLAAFKEKYEVDKLPKKDGELRIAFLDDIQGVTTMEQLAIQAAQLYNVDLIVVGGDTTFSAQSWESFSIDPIAFYAGKIPVFINKGMHDNSPGDPIGKIMRADHLIVADKDIHTIGGMSIFGTNDPNQLASLGSGGAAHPTDPTVATVAEANAIAAKKAIEVVCDKHPLIYTVHDRSIGDVVAKTGCVRIVLTGREYAPQTPQEFTKPGVGSTQEIISGSTGAHGSGDSIELGNIHQAGYLDIIMIDKKSGAITNMDLNTVHPDATYSIDTPSYFERVNRGKKVEAAAADK